MCSERGRGRVSCENKGLYGMDGVSFFFQQKFLVLAADPSRGAVGLGVGLRCWV